MNPTCSRYWFLSSVFFSIFVNTLYIFDSRHIGLYSIVSVFDVVSYTAFSVSMMILPWDVAVPFVISRSLTKDIIASQRYATPRDDV